LRNAKTDKQTQAEETACPHTEEKTASKAIKERFLLPCSHRQNKYDNLSNVKQISPY